MNIQQQQQDTSDTVKELCEKKKPSLLLFLSLLVLFLRCVLHKPLREATTPFDSFSRALLGVIFYDDAWNIKRENTIHGVQRKAIPVRIPRKDIVNHDDLTTCFRKNGSILDGVVGDRRVSNAGHTDRCAYVIETHRFKKQLYVSVYNLGGTRLSYINQTHTSALGRSNNVHKTVEVRCSSK